MINGCEEIKGYFDKCFSYGSLFILTIEGREDRFVAEIKNINDGQGEISFIPLDDEGFPFLEGVVLDFVNESSNVNFKTTVVKNHATKWLTTELPKNLRMINLRQSERIMPAKEHILAKSSITSYGEDGLKKVVSFNGELIDISETGMSILVKARRLDGLFRSDIVELNISQKHSFLSRIRGEVVHKSVSNIDDEGDRSYKIGVQFQKKQNITSLMA